MPLFQLKMKWIERLVQLGDERVPCIPVIRKGDIESIICGFGVFASIFAK